MGVDVDDMMQTTTPIRVCLPYDHVLVRQWPRFLLEAPGGMGVLGGVRIRGACIAPRLGVAAFRGDRREGLAA